MTKTRNGILLASALLAVGIVSGRAMAEETGSGDALASWGMVPTTELAAQRGREGVDFDYTVIDIDIGVDIGSAAVVGPGNSGAVANDGSTAIGSLYDSVAAVDSGTAIGDGAQAGDNGTAVGANNSGGVATGDGTIAVGGDASNSFNTTDDTYLVGDADATGTITNSSIGSIGSTGAISNLGIYDTSGVSILMNNTGALVNMQNSMVFNVYMQ